MPAVLTSTLTNPLISDGNGFAGHALALRLNVDFSGKRILPMGLANLKITSGSLAGSTVLRVFNLVNSSGRWLAFPKP
jgi:hypothetical protein